jgi:hypothetical protein
VVGTDTTSPWSRCTTRSRRKPCLSATVGLFRYKSGSLK